MNARKKWNILGVFFIRGFPAGETPSGEQVKVNDE
jgi:hypothetical protein